MRWRAVYRTTAAALLALAAVRTAAAAGGNAVRELGEASAATSGQLWRPLSRTYQAPATATAARPLPEAPRRCRKAAVVTTINAPTDAIRSVAAAPGWCLIVVGDAITPDDEYEALASGFEGVTYLSLAAQRELPFESIPLTPERHFGRKNIGYLYATWCGAHVIFDFDDDNAPLSAAALDGPGHVAPAGSALLHGEGPSTRPGPHACNPYPFFGAPKAWPRGLPLERINQGPCATATATRSEHRLGVVQSLANRDPDVDAIYRLGPRAALPLPFSFASEAPLLVLAPGAVAPFNAQATWWYGPAFGGLMLPTTVHGRVSDIWRSYVAQHAMRCDHLRLAFATPAVEQVRNDHEYLKDYMAERPLYEASGALVEALAAVPCAGTLGATIGKAYVVLYEKGFVEREDVARADAFLRDLGRARAGAPRGDSDSARPYTAEQLAAWWAPHGDGPTYSGEQCARAPREPTAPPRIAVLLRGEAFRANPTQRQRVTCTDASIAAQARISATHVEHLFRWMEKLGFAVDIYGVAHPCTTPGRGLAGPALLSRWYRPWLRAPVGVVGKAAPLGPGDPHVEVQKRSRRALVEMLGADIASYSHVLLTRWDMVFTATPPACLLATGAGGGAYNSRDVRGSSDQDKMQLVNAPHVWKWVRIRAEIKRRVVPRTPAIHRSLSQACAVVGQDGCSWDGCTRNSGLPMNGTCTGKIRRATMSVKAPPAWWRPLGRDQAAALSSLELRVPKTFDAVRKRGAIVPVFL